MEGRAQTAHNAEGRYQMVPTARLTECLRKWGEGSMIDMIMLNRIIEVGWRIGTPIIGFIIIISLGLWLPPPQAKIGRSHTLILNESFNLPSELISFLIYQVYFSSGTWTKI
jgi:hypothetical protein